MKYTVYDASQYIKVGETDSEVEALKLRDQFMETSAASDCVIEDEDGNYFDLNWDLFTFVNEIFEHSTVEKVPMNAKEALRTLMEWYKCGVNIPEDMTAEILSYIWNECIENDKEAKAAGIAAMDEEIAARYPNDLRFRKAYEDGSSAFFDPDQLSMDLQRTGYDEVHREIIAKALMAYQKSCQDNM